MKDRALGVAAAAVLSLLGCSNDTFTSDDGGMDASNDGVGPADGSRADEGVPDVFVSDGEKGDGGPPIFSCGDPAPGTLFCDDFDSQATVNAGFTTPIIFNGGSVSFDGASYVSSPRSAHAEIPQGAGASAAAALVYQSLGVSFKTMSIRSAVRVHSIDDAQYIPFLTISYVSNLGSGSAIISIGASQKHLVLGFSQAANDGGVAINSGSDLGAYSLDQWFVLTLVVNASASPVVLTAFVDTTKTQVSAPIGTPKDNTRNYQMGLDAQDTADTSVDYDDFAAIGL